MGWTKHTIPGLQPSLITYTSLIKASAQTGDLFSAEAWLRAAESSGLRLDIQIFTAVIDAAARADPNGRIDGELVIQTG
jgi:pentatricopeptide repeat protein